jgi:DNA-directed RNA polymerase specialized sigma subunit
VRVVHVESGKLVSVTSILDERCCTILRLWADGWRDREIAEHIGISQQHVNRLRQESLAELRQHERPNLVLDV